MPNEAPVICRVLGPVEIIVRGTAAPPELLWRKHLALLVYLARSPKRSRTREHLTALLWQDKSETAARHSLHEAVRVLRRAVGDELVDSSGGQIRLAAGAVRLDVDDLVHHLEREEFGEATPLIVGEFLEGFGIGGAQGFEEWLAAERRWWRERCVIVLCRHADLLLRRGRGREAIEMAERATQLDPVSDAAARELMLSLALSGDGARAVAHYDAFAARLQEDVGAGPGLETRALAARVRAERTWRRHGPPAATSPAETRRAPLVGRDRELEAMLDVWAKVRERPAAAAAIVVGDPGTGKSRMLQELLARARLDGATVSAARAVEGDAQRTWNGVFTLARGGLVDAPGLPAAAPEALAAFVTRCPEWASRFSASTAGPSLAPDVALSVVIGAVIAERAVVLAVDDAQWVDPESLSALLALLRDWHRSSLLLLLGVGTAPQRDEIDRLRTQLGDAVPGAVVTLTPLDSTAMRELCAWALPSYTAVEVDRVARRIAMDSAGLPLLAVELAHGVASGLDLKQASGAWPAPLRTLDHTFPGNLPDTVVAAIRLGFRRLSTDAKETLIALSIGGVEANPEQLALATRLNPSQLGAALDELEWSRWVVSDARGYSFVARIAQRVVEREMVTAGQRRRFRQQLRPGGEL